MNMSFDEYRVLSLAENYTQEQIASFYNMSLYKVCEIFKKYNVRANYRRLSFNELTVSSWNKISAYCFGYWLGDGCLTKSVKDGIEYKKISIVSKEADNLKNIKNALGLEAKITKVIMKEHTISGRKSSSSIVYQIQMGHKKLIEILESIGAQYNKTYRGLISYPNIPSDMWPDVVRGLLDSDGCIMRVGKNKDRGRMYLMFSEESMLNWVNENIPFSGIVRQVECDSGRKCYRIDFSKDSVVKELYNWMYYPGCICGERKRKVFEDLYGEICKFKKIVSVDVDGTLIEESNYPIPKKVNKRLIDALVSLQNDGWLVIINTAREGYELDMAIKVLGENGLISRYINENIPSEVAKWGNPRKVVADYYIDDRMMTIEQCCTMGEAIYEATKDSK